ncbi:hypothetical protein BH09MYX1_BH09MYX1_55560 [soil metagenome]
MPTKAEAFRAETARNANKPKAKKVRVRRDSPVDTAKPGTSATDRKAGAGRTATRNASKRVAKRGGAQLEDSATGKPSRKSTRKSSGRAKRTTNLERKATRAASSPKTRAAKG